LYLRPFAFGAPTGGNAPCSNMFGTLSTILSHYKIKKEDSGNGQQCCQSTAMRNKMGNAQSANCLPVNKSMASWRSLKKLTK
ncbi:hypothetical protein T02_16099, partial [Trichinella nativa]